MLRSISGQLLYLSELVPDHIEKVDGRFVKETTGHVHVTRPNGILQFAPVHLDMGRMGLIFGQQIAQSGITRSKTPVVAYLKNSAAGICGIAKLPRVLDPDRIRFLAEDVASGGDGIESNFLMRLVGAADQNRVAVVYDLFA